MVFRVSEVYASVQGEGPNVGETTVFVRFGGCNLRCLGWPCDTQHAIDPAYRKEWERLDPADLSRRIDSVAQLAGARLITLTGGEPFLQREDDLRTLVESLSASRYRVEAFTNGTILYPEWAVENVSMIMDWKLPASRENPYDANRWKNLRALDEASIWHSVKFVCADESDFRFAQALWESMPPSTRQAMHWYYGRVWNGNISNAELAELAMLAKLPWKLNVQMHNYIWPAHERGR